jgi:ribose-phosphate pyrophosphokinase
MDDMIDSGHTMASSANLLKKHGARKIYGYAVHGVFTGDCKETIKKSVLQKIIVTNTIQLPEDIRESFPDKRVTQASVGLLLSEAIRRIH